MNEVTTIGLDPGERLFRRCIGRIVNRRVIGRERNNGKDLYADG